MIKQTLRPTELLISSEAIAGNMRAIKRRMYNRARVMAIVKADAYGHGAVGVSEIALRNGADMLGVALTEEGIQLREAGITAPILVLGGETSTAARALVDNNLICALYDEETLHTLQDEAAKTNGIAHAHLKIDTGMHRIGISPERVGAFLDAIEACPRVKLEGVFTHYSCSGSDPEFTRRQDAQFREALSLVRARGHHVIAHAAASDACLRDETLCYDLVRPGIAIYGAQVRHLCPSLTPAQTLVTKPVRIERIGAGETVGYAATFTAARDTLVATIPVGYGDGYFRCLSGKAAALVQGVRCPVIGRVCMDMMMLDVTGTPGITREDTVTLLGTQGGETITPDELATLANTIPYEIMLGFSSRVPRRMV